jgi:hypothetical protein
MLEIGDRIVAVEDHTLTARIRLGLLFSQDYRAAPSSDLGEFDRRSFGCARGILPGACDDSCDTSCSKRA